MAIAIPLIAFGVLYVLSNQKKEQFEMRRNFPTAEPVTEHNDTNYYIDPNNPKERHLNRPTPPNLMITDMAGRQVHANDFVSENMVPFFGKTKAIGPEFRNQVESELDHKVGAGTLQITKGEPSPLFKPEENIQYPHGSPNQSEFYQSRVNPSLKASNVKPFQSEMVAPGLNQGYTTAGSGGFNSGMGSRDKWLDKTVNELRVATDPKVSYELAGHQGPAQTLVKNLGIEGKVEKHLPDTFFINSPDRYLTTTGAEVAPTLRAIQPNPTIHRATTTKPYTGNASGGVAAQTQHPMVREDHRKQHIGPEQFTPARGNVPQNNLSGVQGSYISYSNNRTEHNHEHSGNVQSLVNAITAPITDFLRPNKKGLALGQKRLGNASGMSALPVLPEAGPVTTKETTMFSPYALGARPHNSAGDGYMVANPIIEENNRMTTSVQYIGGAAMASQQTSYSAATSISANRVYEGRTPAGNANVFNNSITQSSTERHHPAYMGMPAASSVPPVVQRNETRAIQTYDNTPRENPDLLQAFRSNPYTHSLTSVA